jgi:hypothetical protein
MQQNDLHGGNAAQPIQPAQPRRFSFGFRHAFPSIADPVDAATNRAFQLQRMISTTTCKSVSTAFRQSK